MPQESILFGSIAVAMGRITPAQIQECLDLQEKWTAIGVRKLIGQVLHEKGYLTDRGVREVLKAQAYRTQRLESKDYARIAVECGFATAEQVRECLAAQKENYRKGGGMHSLGRILQDRGYLDRRAHDTVMRTVNRVHGRTAAQFHTTAVLYGVKECTVCFEMIDFRADRCDRCGTFLGEVQIKPECPSCHAAQEPGGEFCSQCGANMVTGLRGGAVPQVQCHACGGWLAAGQDQCYHCGRHRPLPILRRIAAWTAGRGLRAAGSFASQMFLLAALVALALGLIWAPAIVREVKALVRGDDAVRLESAFETVRLALLYGDDDGLRAQLADPAAAPAGPELVRLLTGAAPIMRDVEAVAVQLDQSHVDGDGATTYAQLDLRYAPAASSGEVSLEELWSEVGTGTLTSGKRVARRRITWRWTRAGDRWRLVWGK